jgi:hypothetical protein
VTRHRRIAIRIAVLGTIGAAAFGYAMEGVGLAIFEGLLLAVIGVGLVFLAPQQRPPSPAIVPRPAVGDSRDAIRRRRTAGFVIVWAGLPFVLCCVGLAVVVPWGPAAYAAIAIAVAYLVLIVYGFVLSAMGGERFDRLRVRHYERTVERLNADRELYEATVDAAAEADKGKRLFRWFVIVQATLGAMGVLLLLIVGIAALF